jgi:hypothetical protein
VLDDASVAAFLDACGGVTALADLTVERGRLLGTFLQAHDDVGAQLLECRRAPGAEWLILEIDVDVGQAPVVDIRRQERIAVGFGEADAAWPEVAALRADWPAPEG